MRGSAKRLERFIFEPVPMSNIDWLVDVVIAAGAFGFGLIQLALSTSFLVPDDFTRRLLGVRSAAPTALAVTANLAICLPLVVRRRLPWVSLAATLVVWAACEWVPGVEAASTISPLVALFTVAYVRGRREAPVAVCIVLAITLWPALSGLGSGLDSILTLQNAACAIAVGFAGYAFNARKAAMDAAEARANAAERLRESETCRAEAAERLSAIETKRAIEAERTRESEASRRVEEERVRIAREVHDITAHSLSAVSIQAAAAERLIDSDPDAARAAISEVRATAKAALGEMRAMVGVLRYGDDAATRPTGGTEQMGELASYLESAGIACELDEGSYDRSRVPRHVDIALFVIAREACTNIVRHSGAKSATVGLSLADGMACLEVCDDGCGAGDEHAVLGAGVAALGGAGHGIEGMRERAKLLGGTFEVNCPEAGGTLVRVEIPASGRTS